jgi:hypothetical protein
LILVNAAALVDQLKSVTRQAIRMGWNVVDHDTGNAAQLPQDLIQNHIVEWVLEIGNQYIAE